VSGDQRVVAATLGVLLAGAELAREQRRPAHFGPAGKHRNGGPATLMVGQQCLSPTFGSAAEDISYQLRGDTGAHPIQHQEQDRSLPCQRQDDVRHDSLEMPYRVPLALHAAG